MADPLDNLCGPGKALRAEAPDAAELAGRIRSGLARLNDAGNTSLSLESSFDTSQSATARRRKTDDTASVFDKI